MKSMGQTAGRAHEWPAGVGAQNEDRNADVSWRVGGGDPDRTQKRQQALHPTRAGGIGRAHG